MPVKPMLTRVSCSSTVLTAHGFTGKALCTSKIDHTMIDYLEKYIIHDKDNIAWRFAGKLEILAKVNLLNSEYSELLWSKLDNEAIVNQYSLIKTKFTKFEEWHFSNHYEWVTERLNDLTNSNARILLTWADKNVLETDVKTFISNWELFYNPVADDLIAINEEDHWVVYITHYELFQFGKIIENKK